MRRFVFGQDFSAQRNHFVLTHSQAREMARNLSGSGSVWMCAGKHWTIVANYSNGTVWNGQAQCVPCKPNPKEDWELFAGRGTA